MRWYQVAASKAGEGFADIAERLRPHCAHRERYPVKPEERQNSPDLQHLLARAIGEDRYDLWFGQGVQLSVAGDELRVAASDSFTLDRIRKSFREELRQVAGQVAGDNARVAFITSSEEPADTTGDVSASTSSSQLHAKRAAPSINPASLSAAQAGDSNRHGRRKRRFATLATFIAGENNRIAHTAASVTASQPGHSTPLFFHGPTGCGKTHLLEGVWSTIRRSGEVKRIVMLSAEQFTCNFLEALQGSGLPSFRRKHRDVEVLLIDDVQFFVKKKATLVELLHTIDTLLRDGRQLVFAADRAPAELPGLGAEIINRLAGGLVCRVEPASEDVRLKLLQQMSRRRGVKLPASVASLMAEKLTGDARQLAGAFNRLVLAAGAYDQPISTALASRVLADLFRNARKIVKLSDVERAICDEFNIDARSLQSAGRSRAVSQPRMLAMWLARKHTRAAYAEIGEYFGNRSHSTVISARKKVDGWVEDGSTVDMNDGPCVTAEALRRLESRLRTG